MKLSAPTKPVFWISVILAIIALISQFITIPVLSGAAFWVLFIAYLVLFVGNVAKGV